MPLPLLAVGAGMTLAGALMKRRKPQLPDMTGLTNMVNSGAEANRGLIRSAFAKTPAMAAKFQADTGAAVGAADAARTGVMDRYRADSERTNVVEGQSLSDVLRQRVMETQPELQAASREALAASGGLNRGAAPAAAMRIATEAGRGIGEGEQAIALQQMEHKRQMVDSIAKMDESWVRDKLGISRETLATIYQSGREDLIAEANAMLGVNENQQDSLLGIEQNKNTMNFARSAAGAEQRNMLLNTLMGAGMTTMAYGATAPAAAAAPAAPSVNSAPALVGAPLVAAPAGVGVSASPVAGQGDYWRQRLAELMSKYR